jgi:hypothetical protein
MLYPTTPLDVLAVHVRTTECETCCTPVPDKAIAGELVALLATATLPLTAPATEGANVTFNVAAWVGANVVPDAPLVLNPAPDAVTADIVTFEFPVFVRVTLSELLLPTLTLLKLRLVGLALSRWVADRPVPLNGIASDEFGVLLTTEIDPVTLPVAVGVKTALNVVLTPGLIVIGSAGSPLMLKPAPDTLAWEIDTAAVPPFVKLIVCELLFPMMTFPKLALDGFAPSCGWMPVPLSEIVRDELGALLVIEMLPLAVPTPDGENWTVNAVLCPGFRVVADNPLML